MIILVITSRLYSLFLGPVEVAGIGDVAGEDDGAEDGGGEDGGGAVGGAFWAGAGAGEAAEFRSVAGSTTASSLCCGARCRSRGHIVSV